MDIEFRKKVPERKLTEASLADRLHAFSDTLARGRWLNSSMVKVETSQCIAEELGGEFVLSGKQLQATEAQSQYAGIEAIEQSLLTAPLELSGEDNEGNDIDAEDESVETEELYVSPISSFITISFSAEKRYTVEDNGAYMLPKYVLTSTISQTIDKTEIPPHILDAIFNDASDSHNEAHDLLSAAGYDSMIVRGEGYSEEDDDTDNLDDFDIKRIQEVEYRIDFDGNIEHYSISYQYSFDDSVLHRIDYDTKNEKATMLLVKNAVGTDERRPSLSDNLDASEVEKYIATIGTQTDSFFEQELLRDLEQVTDIPKQEHIRRVMGMVGMLSSGYKPRRWYNRIYDNLLYRRER